MRFDLDDLLIFVRVAQAGSFTTAGKELGMPKSSVSRRVAKLEEDLQTRLLQRTTRHLSLTDLGQVFYERAREIVAAAEEAEREVLDSRSEPSGRLRITAPTEFASGFGSIVRFLERYPEIDLEVEFTSRVVDLVGEGFDLAVRAGSLTESNLIARKLVESRVLLVASPSYLERAGEPRRLEELAEHDIIVVSTRGPRIAWTFLIDGGKELVVPLRARAKVNHYEAARSLAIGGAGIARIPDTVCGEDLAAGRLRVLFPEHCAPSGSIYAVYPSARHLSANVRALIDFLATDAVPGTRSAPPDEDGPKT